MSQTDEAGRCECEKAELAEIKEDRRLREYPAYTGQAPPSYKVICAPQSTP